MKHLMFSNRKRLYNRKRAVQSFSKHDFLYQRITQSICERVQWLKIPPRTILIIDDMCGVTETAIKNIFPNAEISTEDNIQKHANKYDCIISNMNVHWENSPHTTLQWIYTHLKPEGVFLASLFGNDTLKDLRHAFVSVESALYNSVTPHIAPMIDVKTLGDIMMHCGYNQPVVDCETVYVSHKNLMGLFHDLRGMGENSAINVSGRMITKSFLNALDAEYKQTNLDKNDNLLDTRFDILYVIGWARK